MKKNKIFIDSNVFIAGIVSSKGASGNLLRLISESVFNAYICKLVIWESERNIQKKLPKFLPYFYYAIGKLPLVVLKDSANLDKKIARNFPKKSDQIIFETANKLQLDYFLTLNRKHFHQKAIRKIAHFKIRTPAQFLDKWRGI